MTDIRLPNITGDADAKTQVAQMRSYLYQMVEQLNWALNTLDSGKAAVENGTVISTVAGGSGESSEEVLGKFKGLRDLIEKSAETAKSEIKRLDDELGEVKKDYKSIQTVEEEYYRSTSPTELVGGEWVSQYPGWVEGTYIWTRSVIRYTDGTEPTKTAAVCVTGSKGATGAQGPQGEKGAQGNPGTDGVGVESVDVEYRLSGSGEKLTGTDDEGQEYTWQTEMPALKNGLYLWSRNKVTYTDGTVKYAGQYCVTKAAWDAVAGKVDGKIDEQIQAVYRSMEELETNLKGRYVAQGDFGTFAEDTNARIKANAEAIDQKYEDIQSLRSEVDEVAGAVVAVNANIRTGLLYYDNGTPVYGVEVGQRTQLNGTEVFNKYARFISNRLSFYDQGGNEVSYISDYKLYITNAVVTGNLQVGGYMLDTGKGLGFKWIGR
nr:MAG TPA: tail protein [Caudoviricetes sp.]